MENDKTSVDLDGYGMNSGLNENEAGSASPKSPKKIGMGAAAGIGVGAAVIGAGAAAVPFFAFAHEDGSDPAETTAEQETATTDSEVAQTDVASGSAEEVAAATDGTMETASVDASEHVAVASDLTLAGNVTDDMTFAQAFAAARAEVGPGGMFYYHGHAYGTYYETEWNAMSEDDKADYWASVNHTVAEHPNPHPFPPTPLEPELITEFSVDDIEDISLAGAITVDANRNDDPDVIVDIDGDGVGDVLLVDVKTDDEGNVLSVGNAMEGQFNYLNGLEDESDDDYAGSSDDVLDGMDGDDTVALDDSSDALSYNADYDFSSNMTLDTDALIENDVDTTDMV